MKNVVRQNERNKVWPLWIATLLVGIFTINLISCNNYKQATEEVEIVAEEDTTVVHYPFGIDTTLFEVTEYTIRNGDNIGGIFNRLGLGASRVDSICKVATGVLDPTKLRAGMHYMTFNNQETPEKIDYIAFAKSQTDYAVIDLRGDSVIAYEYNKPVTYKRHYAEGTLNTSLWNVLKASGANPLLALKISDVFAWQIDFFDIKNGDSFEVIYDVAYIDDTTALHVASIEGAIFKHQGKEYTAIPFTQDSVFEYFDAEGNSLRKAFLKAPLDFFRITSRFTNSRFHPVLKRYRAHHGVDYAAPVGTPVKSIGAGTVIAKGYESGGGNYIKVKHNAVYTTSYMHLSKFAKNIQIGSHIQQGQEIGYVGSTGLSTGPHLDFRVYKNGQPIDPLTMEAPPSLPVKPELTDSFQVIRQQIFAEIETFRNNNIPVEELNTERNLLTEVRDRD